MYSDKTVPGSNGNSNIAIGQQQQQQHHHHQQGYTNGTSTSSRLNHNGKKKGQNYKSMHTMELTPQPDNYSCIKSCPHINNVFESTAKETVFETYRQAVLISQPVTTDKIYQSRKDHSLIPPSEILASKIMSLKCDECHLSDFENSMICLQCPHVGCCFNDKNHSYSHFKSSQHQFSIDSGSGLLYCYKCDDFINHPDLERIRMKVIDPDYSTSANDEENYSDPGILATRGLKGFVNLGATCFMSSILQTLIHNPIIKYHFFNNDLHYFNCERGHNQYVNNGFIDENNACLTCSMDNIFQNFFTADNLDGFALSNFLATSWHKKKSLAGFQEQDAHEFFQFLLNELHVDHSRIMTALGGEDTDNNTAQSHTSTCTCISHSVYGFQLKSSIECDSCFYVSNTMEHVNDLSLELNNSGSLYDCLDQFTKEEKLEHYSCTKCSSVKTTTKTLKIQTAPAVLTLHMKRFKHDLNSTKIETKIEVPMFLNLSKYSVENGDKVKQIYELFGVVVHEGSISTGHYTVYIKTSGQWYKCDDSVVSLVNQEEVLNSNAYLLFYIL